MAIHAPEEHLGNDGFNAGFFFNNNNNTGSNNPLSFYQPVQQQNLQQLQFLLHQNPTVLPQQGGIDLPVNFAAEFDRQKLDLDRFICLQSESLRFALQEQRREQLGLIQRTYEATTQALLRQKDSEITEAAKKTIELETILKGLETENEVWKKVAKEKETIVNSLTNTFQRLRQSASLAAANAADDAESCCENNDNGVRPSHDHHHQALVIFDNGDNSNNDQQRGTRNMMCKNCNVRSTCVVFLPCRHLSCCSSCVEFLDSCPICRAPKRYCIKAVLS